MGGAIGTIGDLLVIGFADSKMIGGRGGLVLTDDPDWRDLIDQIALDPALVTIDESDQRIRAYADQLRLSAPGLIRPFNDAPDNLAQIEAAGQIWQRMYGCAMSLRRHGTPGCAICR